MAYNYHMELKTLAVALSYTLQAYSKGEIVEEPFIEAVQQFRECRDTDVIEIVNSMLKALETFSDYRGLRDYLYEDLEYTLSLYEKEEIYDCLEYAQVLFGINDAELVQLWRELQPQDINAGCWAQHWFI